MHKQTVLIPAQRLFTHFIGILFVLSLTACSVFSPYHIEVQQGNVIEQSHINKLSIGMKKEQVNFILGSPMLKDMFHINRWDFYYSFKNEQRETTSKHFSLYFNENGLSRLEGASIEPETEDQENQTSILISEQHREEESRWYDTILWWRARKE